MSVAWKEGGQKAVVPPPPFLGAVPPPVTTRPSEGENGFRWHLTDRCQHENHLLTQFYGVNQRFLTVQRSFAVLHTGAGLEGGGGGQMHFYVNSFPCDFHSRSTKAK